MPTVKMKLKQLEDADVNFISLVGRPASRIPFKVTKSEGKPMFHLNKLFRQKSEEQASSVAAVVVSKSASPEVAAKLTDLGFKVDNVYKAESDSDIYVQGDANLDVDNLVPVQVTKDVGVLLDKVTKGFDSYPDSTEFSVNIDGAGFMPNLYTATDVMVETIRNNLYMGETQAEAVAGVKATVDAYAAYVKDMVDNLPDVVFKLEAALTEVEKSEVSEPDSVADPEPIGEAAAEGDVEVDASAEAEVEDEVAADAAADSETEVVAKDADTEEGDAEVQAAPEAEGETEQVAKSETDEADAELEEVAKSEAEPDKMDAVMKAISGLQDSLTEVTKSFDAKLEDVQKSLGERVAKAEEVAKSADEALSGAVLQRGDSADAGGPAPVTKSEGDDLWAGSALDKIVSG